MDRFNKLAESIDALRRLGFTDVANTLEKKAGILDSIKDTVKKVLPGGKAETPTGVGKGMPKQPTQQKREQDKATTEKDQQAAHENRRKVVINFGQKLLNKELANAHLTDREKQEMGGKLAGQLSGWYDKNKNLAPNDMESVIRNLITKHVNSLKPKANPSMDKELARRDERSKKTVIDRATGKPV